MRRWPSRGQKKREGGAIRALSVAIADGSGRARRVCYTPLPASLVRRRGECRLFIVKDHDGKSLAYVYFEDEPGRASGNACCSGGLDSALTECVGMVLSSNASAKTHAKLTIKARVRADSTRVRSTNDTSLCIPLKKETPLPCSGSQSPIA
jgi:hypothetical protein